MTTRVPRLEKGADLTGLPLKPTDGYVLSCIDGASSTEQIASVTGVNVDRVEEVVELLVSHGAAQWIELKERRSPAASAGPVHTRPPPPGTSRTLYDPRELEEPDVELPEERRRTILDTYYRLDELDFYELLGVDDDGDKKAIRAAYFALSKVFHPDTAFGKSLGSYKSKMESVFKRLTEAYDVLGKKRSRKEYDNYIRLRRRTRAAQKRLEVGAREAERLEKEVTKGAERAVVLPESEQPTDATDSAPQTSPPTEPTIPEPPAPSQPAARSPRRAPPPASRPRSDAAKDRARKLMARKLAAATGRRMPGSSSSEAQKPERPSQTPREAKASRDVLLRGLAESLKQVASFTGGVDRATATLQRARAAEAKGDLVSASNLLRMAVALSQERPEIVEEYDRVAFELAQSMADDYQARAEYEEGVEQWTDAALSWAKVCEGRPDDGNAHVHAAKAILEAGGDLGTAKLYAQKGMELAPDEKESHVVLARVFYAAGMKLNAKRELERAIELDPGDEFVKNLLRELGK